MRYCWDTFNTFLLYFVKIIHKTLFPSSIGLLKPREPIRSFGQVEEFMPYPPSMKNMRNLSDLDKKILAKIAPEFQGATGPAPGHDYKFILLPVSHKLSDSPEDFANRVNRLTDDELAYVIDLIKKGDEDIRSLAEGDYDALLEMIEKRLPEKV